MTMVIFTILSFSLGFLIGKAYSGLELSEENERLRRRVDKEQE